MDAESKASPQAAALPWRISNNLAAWYLVAASSELAEGGVRQAQLGSREIVLFRSEGQVQALDPYCAHMGAKLCNGEVQDGFLACPLHGWKYRGDGQVAGGTDRIKSWPVVERMGGVLVFNGPEPLYQAPPEQPEFHWSAAPSTLIDCPWLALTANAFDTHHYQAVHRRRLVEPPKIWQTDPWTFSCSYISEVTGGQLSDRLMDYLSQGHIRVRMTCYGGPIFTVRSELGKRRASLLVGVEPRGDTTQLRLLVGSPGKGVPALLARYLYTSFLRSDLKPMTGARLNPYTGLQVDEVMEAFARYLEALPVASS